MNETISMLDVDGDPILFIEMHDGHPHSVVTEGATYDFQFIPDSGDVLYRNVGSGCRDKAISIGRMCDPSKPVSFWTAPGVRIVDEEGKDITIEQAAERGFVPATEISNPFDTAIEGRAIYCSVTGEAWNEEAPSPYMRYMNEIGEWGGCGAGDDYIGKAASGESMVDLARVLGVTKARRLAKALHKLNETLGAISFEIDHYGQSTKATIILPDHTRFDFTCPEKIEMIEPAIAWIESVDGDKAFGEAISAVNWLEQASHKLATQTKAAKAVKIPRAMRPLWKAICATGCHVSHEKNRALVLAFLKSIKG